MRRTLFFSLLLTALCVEAAPLKIGWGITDVSSDEPLVQYGRPKRYISQGLRDPLAVTTLVIDNGEDCVIFSTWDVCVVWGAMVHRVRSIVHDRWSAVGRRGGQTALRTQGRARTESADRLEVICCDIDNPTNPEGASE